MTSYRESHDGADKVWITVDGVTVFSCKHYNHERALIAAYLSGLQGDELESALRAVEIHSPRDFGDAIRSYLDMPVADALKSPDPIVQAFAIIDRRIRKRTLVKMKLSDCPHPLVKTFLRIA